MLVNIAAGIVGILVFLFIFWKRMREDYSGELVFGTAFIIIAAAGLLLIIGNKFFPQGFFYSGFIGAFLGLFLGTYLNKVRFYETMEALVISSLPLLSLMFLSHSAGEASMSSFFGFLAALFLIFIFYYLNINYKTFAWYKSGKIGFSGLSVLISMFLIRFILAMTGIDVLSFVGVYEVWVSGILMVVFAALLVILGRKI